MSSTDVCPNDAALEGVELEGKDHREIEDGLEENIFS